MNDSSIRTTKWTQKLHLLQEFVSINDRLPRMSETYQDIELGKWMEHQRTHYRNKELSEEKTIALSVIPGWHWRWETNVSLLKKK